MSAWVKVFAEKDIPLLYLPSIVVMTIGSYGSHCFSVHQCVLGLISYRSMLTQLDVLRNKFLYLL